MGRIVMMFLVMGSDRREKPVSAWQKQRNGCGCWERFDKLHDVLSQTMKKLADILGGISVGKVIKD